MQALNIFMLSLHVTSCDGSFNLFIHRKIKFKLAILTWQEIEAAISALGPPLAGRVFAMTEGFWMGIAY